MTALFATLILTTEEKTFYEEIIRSNGENGLIAVWARTTIIEGRAKKEGKK